jgi:4-amino-4-deoxy-L-arabinose transferase-like glycosyltransferase
MHQTDSAKRRFIALWAAVTLFKCVLAARLPLFVDEAFYWQEGRHLAWAYSDLPGLTAWLTRLGVESGGHGLLGLRWPFLLIAALLPWWLVKIARREGDAAQAWTVGMLAVLLPLLGTLGVLALPDVPLALATLCCLDAGTRLMRSVDWAAAALLAIGLAIGGLTHYRFVAVIGVGFLVLLWLPQGRRALRDARVWLAVCIGAFAWLPLLLWNVENADAGLRFQLVERHPWAFHPDGALFIAVQALLVTPLLLFALLRAGFAQRTSSAASGLRYLAWSGLLVLAGFFALGFFADTERVSFHWPLPGYLALLPLAPQVLSQWPHALRRAAWALAALGLVAGLGYYAAVSSPTVRERAAASKWYPSNFAGWSELAREVGTLRARMPADTRIVADNFKIGSELGFALNDPRIAVLDHPLNHHHGRAPQLRLWQLHEGTRNLRNDAHRLLVVGATDVSYREQLQHYHDLCAMVGPLPPPTVLNIDRGRQRFLLFALPSQPVEGDCTAPAMAWIDVPSAGDAVAPRFALRGWAFKDGVGLSRIEVLIDGLPVAEAEYGIERPEVVGFWRKWRTGGSTDPQQPGVGFAAQVDLGERTPNTYWLGLRLHGRDGSVEDWPEQAVVLR